MNKIILTNKWDMNYVAKVFSELLSEQFDADITVTFTPKTEEEKKA